MVAEIVVVKDDYGAQFTTVRRRRPMSLAGEITWNLMPPLTFGTDRVVIACVLAPAYDVGGDSFDYAVDHSTTGSAPGCWYRWRWRRTGGPAAPVSACSRR